MNTNVRRCVALALGLLFSSFTVVRAEDKPADKAITVAEGKMIFEAPKDWVRRQPKSRIVEHEFAAIMEGAKEEGRLTVMGAGGGVEANISRWAGQFTQPDGSATKANTQQLKVAGVDVHYVDLSGDYKDQAGPFNPAPATVRKDYRMLGAIVVTEELGQYFLKFYGPKDLVTANKKAFDEMVNSLKVKK